MPRMGEVVTLVSLDDLAELKPKTPAFRASSAEGWLAQRAMLSGRMSHLEGGVFQRTGCRRLSERGFRSATISITIS